MKRLRVGVKRHDRGFAIVELLVAVVIFALLVVMIDAVFATVNRTSRTVELASDVQQNARVALERLTREIRESPLQLSSTYPIQVGGTWVAFSSARLSAKREAVLSPTTLPERRTFCLDVASTDSQNPDCAAPLTGSYLAVPQATIVYWLDPMEAAEAQTIGCTPGTGFLRRSVQSLTSSPTISGGDVVATCISQFAVTRTNRILDVTLGLSAVVTAQGTRVQQQLTLTGKIYLQND